MTAHTAKLAKHLKNPRVLVVGDILLDQYTFGAVHRISPEAPIPVLNTAHEDYRLGGAANVAWNLSALGARVSLAGVIGKDASGVLVKKLLRGAKVQTTSIITDPRKPTGTKTRIIAHHQQMLRVDKEESSPLRGSVERALIGTIRRAAGHNDFIVVSDYQKGTLTPRVCRAIIKTKIPVIVGLKGGEVTKFRGATGASLNQAELHALSSVKGGNNILEQEAREMLQNLRSEFLIVTLGERGMAVFSRSGEAITLPTVAREVYDVTGAGDTVLAAFAICFASGLPLIECAHIANAAAGIVVGKLGTAVATRREIIASLNGDEESPARKILKERDLLRTLTKERGRGKKIVFTNGCFDILHVGHIKLLHHAKAQGDLLVVGLNSDDSVRRLKGKNRPITNEDDRAHMLAALEAVDFVIRFSSDTPLALVKKIHPHVLVKGEDWKGKGVVGKEFAERVAFAPTVSGKSTTNVIKQIVERHTK